MYSFPNKYKSLPTEIRKLSQYNSEDNKVSSNIFDVHFDCVNIATNNSMDHT